jgi:hypothetical protein
MSTGKGSGVFVLDIDGPQGEASLAAWEAAGLTLPQSRTHRTGKGRHVLFQWPDGHDIRNSASKAAPGIDVRGKGGYVVIPPSIHAFGAAYEVIDDTAPAEMPKWLLDLVTAVALKAGAAPWDEVIPAGRRNDTLASFAGSLRRHGMGQEAILSVLRAVNAVRCESPLDDRELQTISHSIAEYASRNGS